MEIYIPDIYQKSIHTIDYEALLLRGIKCLLIDLDNTIAPINEKVPNEQTKELFDELKELGFKIIIFSNSHKIRVKPFKEDLEVDCCASARKPKPAKFLAIMGMYNYKESEIAIIGDSIIDDIAGGNGVGITTILVNPIGKKEFPFAKLRRFKENRLVKKLRDNDLFTRGRYYD